MALYQYECPQCGPFELRHSMEATAEEHTCPECGALARRVLLPVLHRWMAYDMPGLEHSGHRMFLNPNRQAAMKDKLAQMKEAKRGNRG